MAAPGKNKRVLYSRLPISTKQIAAGLECVFCIQRMDRIQIDTDHYKRLRKKLVHLLADRGISDQRVLDAIEKVPRHFFVEKRMEPEAYEDRPLPIAEGQTISQPYTVAYQTELLEVAPGQKVLEVGTGSGYQAAVLAHMGVELHTLERQKKIFDQNRLFLYLQSFPNIHFYYADGYLGLPGEAPFDRILLTAAALQVPETLLQQLAPGGMLVAPVGGIEGQEMIRVKKQQDNSLVSEHFDRFSFVPMLQGRQE